MGDCPGQQHPQTSSTSPVASTTAAQTARSGPPVMGCARREVRTMQTHQPSSHSDQARRPGPYPTHRGRISASAPPCTPPCTRTQREGHNSRATARNCATARAQRLATTMLLLLLAEMQAANATSRPRAVPDRLSLSPSRGDRCAPEHADRTGHPCQPLRRAQQPFQHHTGHRSSYHSRAVKARQALN